MSRLKPHYSEKVKVACCSIIHSARGLAVGVLTPIPLRLSLGQPGSVGPVHQKTTRGPANLIGVPRKESRQIWRSSKILVGQNRNPYPATYGNCNWLGLVFRSVTLPPDYIRRAEDPSKKHLSLTYNNTIRRRTQVLRLLGGRTWIKPRVCLASPSCLWLAHLSADNLLPWVYPQVDCRPYFVDNTHTISLPCLHFSFHHFIMRLCKNSTVYGYYWDDLMVLTCLAQDNC